MGKFFFKNNLFYILELLFFLNRILVEISPRFFAHRKTGFYRWRRFFPQQILSFSKSKSQSMFS